MIVQNGWKHSSFFKRIISVLLLLSIVFSVYTASAIAAGVTATPSKSIVYINGKQVSFEAYTINGSNYFKLRDLAMALTDTNKKINVSYNGATNTIDIAVGKDYVPVGGEMSLGDGKSKSATPGKSTIHWIEAPRTNYLGSPQYDYNIALGTYVINGNNFVKLRDFMQWVDVGVGYDSTTASITINTFQNYVLPKYTGNPLKAGETIDNKYRKDYGAQPGSIQNRGELVYHDGWYYHYGFRIQEGAPVSPYKSDYGDYIADNWQVYGNKIFFEGALSSSVTTQSIFTMNLDGSGVKRIITDALGNGQSITVYKGKIYANTYGTKDGKDTSIVSFNLDGTGRKVLYTGNLGVINKNVGYGNRAYHVFDDRIYFLKTDNDSIYSMKLDGSDVKLISTLKNSPWTIISVYDGYIYYETGWQGLHRVKIDGTEHLCVLPVEAEQYAVYGDKIVYNIEHNMLGVVNTDGTGRYQFPNAKQDPQKTTVNYSSNLMVLNSKYTFAQNVVYNNDSSVTGHIEFLGERDPKNPEKDIRGWYYKKEPSINTLKDIVSNEATFKLANGWYNLRCMYNYFYLDSNGGAQLRTTDIKQKFYIEHKYDNYFVLKTEDGKYLGIADNVVNGVQVKAVNNEYMWLLRSENNSDIFSMRPADYSRMILNAAGEKSADGTWIILWAHDKEDAPNHAEFRFIPVN